jgi:integrase
MRPEASENALDLSLIDRLLNQRESESMDPHIRGTGAGDDPTPTRRNIPGLGSIYRRGDRWAIEFWKDGVQHRESARTSSETEALAHLRKRVDESAQNRYVGPRAERVTVKALLALVAQDYATTGNRSSRTLKFRVAALESELGHLRAVAVSSGAIEAYKSKRLGDGKAKATINRELACLRRAYRLASQSRPPLISANRVPTINLYPENNVRQGLVSPEDYLALLARLPDPINDAVTLGYLSGWRRAEVLGLTWSEVDRTRGLITPPAERSENRGLPLSPALAALIEKRWQARLVSDPNGPRVCDRVFHREGEPVRDFRSAWRKAVEAIGQPGLLFHDLRRSAVTNMIRAGVPEQTAMRISGHRTPSVFRRYRIVETKDLLSALTQTESALKADPHKPAISPHNGIDQRQTVAREPIRKIVILRKDIRHTEG